MAWKPLGWKCAFVSEIEPFPCRVLAHHYPDVPNRGDLTRFQEWPDDAIDLLVGGTPCQSFSVAGLRAGMADPRGNLALVFLGLVGRARPRWVVWENVPGVLSSNGGRDFGAFLGGLGQLGYGWSYRVLDAQYFGVAQRRRRVFVVGCLGDWRRAAAVLFERSCLRGDLAPSREAGAGVAGTVEARTCRSVGAEEAANGHLTVAYPDPAYAVTGGPNGNQFGTGRDAQDTYVTHSLRADGFDASEDGTGRGTPLVVNMMGAKSAALVSADGLSPTLNKMHGHDVHAVLPVAAPITACYAKQPDNSDSTQPNLIATGFHSQQDPISEAGLSLPLEAGGGQAVNVSNFERSSGLVRRLTPRECERLQGFPDDYTAIPGAKDSPRYRALGNSMAVPVVRWIGERIASVEAT